jgi:hypothetical protein
MGLPALRTAVLSLAKATLPQAKALRDKAAAIEVYLKRAKEAGRIQNQAAEIRLRAERRIGELLKATVKRGNPQWSHGAANVLAASRFAGLILIVFLIRSSSKSSGSTK